QQPWKKGPLLLKQGAGWGWVLLTADSSPELEAAFLLEAQGWCLLISTRSLLSPGLSCPAETQGVSSSRALQTLQVAACSSQEAQVTGTTGSCHLTAFWLPSVWFEGVSSGLLVFLTSLPSELGPATELF
uniref:Uncharacterized protein n=1 Tax=Anser brachyrhynchus TaxID=132585 RepID=A0A8B9BPE9_9AVES